jgi:hypothetical protein
MKHGKDLQPFGFEERVLGKNATAAPDILGRRAPWNQQGKTAHLW